MPPPSVLFVLFDGVQSLDVTGPLEVFSGANQYLEHNNAAPAYELRTASLSGRPISSSSGLSITPQLALTETTAPHTLVVPGGKGTRTPDPALVEWLRAQAPAAPRVVSVCTGALLLAEAGLLAGRRATTHWLACEQLAERFPEVEVDPEPIFLRDGNICTSAGVTSGIDLALALVEEDLDRHAALTIARHLVVFLRRPGNQRQFSAQLQAQLAQREPLREVQQWINDNPAADLSVHTLADRANLSPRQFARAFAAESGVTPGRYVDSVRLECARRLLEDSRADVEHVARSSGYRTSEALRRAFLRELGVSPAEYRRRF